MGNIAVVRGMLLDVRPERKLYLPEMNSSSKIGLYVHKRTLGAEPTYMCDSADTRLPSNTWLCCELFAL
jgi:hypothetical protein